MSPSHPHELVVLPVGSTAVLHRAHAGHVERVAELGRSSRAVHRVSDSGRRVASLDRRRLVERVLRGDELVVVHERAAPRNDAEGIDMAYVGERLFLAGLFEQDGQVAPVLEAEAGASEYVALPVPEATRWKWVDILVAHGERLIAVDDMIVPRWIYDFTFTPAPAVRHVAALELQMPNGEASAAVMCAGTLCILEVAVHMGGRSSSIGLYDPDDLAVRRAYHAHLGWDERVSSARGGLLPARDIASDGDHLWVASGEHGVGVADLRGLRAVPPIAADASWRDLERRKVPELRYRPAPAGRAVVDLATVPGESGCFALLADHVDEEPTDFVWFRPLAPETA